MAETTLPRRECKHIMRGGSPCGNRCTQEGIYCSLHKKSRGGFKQCPGPEGSDGQARGCGRWVLLKSEMCSWCQKALRVDQSEELAKAHETMKNLADEIVDLRLAAKAREEQVAKAKENVDAARVLVDEVRAQPRAPAKRR